MFATCKGALLLIGILCSQMVCGCDVRTSHTPDPIHSQDQQSQHKDQLPIVVDARVELGLELPDAVVRRLELERSDPDAVLEEDALHCCDLSEANPNHPLRFLPLLPVYVDGEKRKKAKGMIGVCLGKIAAMQSVFFQHCVRIGSFQFEAPHYCIR